MYRGHSCPRPLTLFVLLILHVAAESVSAAAFRPRISRIPRVVNIREYSYNPWQLFLRQHPAETYDLKTRLAERWRCLALIPFVAAVFSCSAQAQSVIAGVVRDQAAKAIEKVHVIGLACKSKNDDRASVITGTDGSFTIGSSCGMIFFRDERIRPTDLKVPNDGKPLEITLEPSGASEWVLPKCATRQQDRADVLYSPILLLPLPRHAKLGSDRGDDDSLTYLYYRGTRSQKLVIHSCFGCGGPPAELLAKSQEITARSVTFWDIPAVAIDVKGRAADGSLWRWISAGPKLTISYEGAAAEAARFFDSLINKACAIDWSR